MRASANIYDNENNYENKETIKALYNWLFDHP